MKKYVLCMLIGFLAQISYGQTITISGHITDAKNGEALIGASVYVETLQKGTASNYYGYYALGLPAGKVKVSVMYMGYQKLEKEVTANQDITLDLKLQPLANNLNEV